MSKEKQSGIVIELQKQRFFLDLELVEKVYLPSEFKKEYLVDGKSRVKLVNIHSLFHTKSLQPVDEVRVILLKIGKSLAGLIVDKVVCIVNDEALDVVSITEVPPGHEILIFDRIFISSGVLCFSKEGLVKLINAKK